MVHGCEHRGRFQKVVGLLALALASVCHGQDAAGQCDGDLGLSSGLLSAQYLGASSSLAYSPSSKLPSGYYPGDARLNRSIGLGGWTPKTSASTEWWQVNFGSVAKIASISTQGFVTAKTGYVRFYTGYMVYVGNSSSSELLPITWPNNTDRVFRGNSDASTIVTHVFSPPIATSMIRLSNFTTHAVNLGGLRVGVTGCPELMQIDRIRACDSPLGVSNGNIPDSSLTAEDYSTSNNRPKYGRLNRTIGYGGWCGINSVTNPNDYFQVDLGNVTYVSAVATQGIIDGHPLGSNAELYTTRYMVKIRNSSSGAWTVLSNIVGAARDQVFAANTDGTTINKQYFSMPVRARYVRFFNFTGSKSVFNRFPCMRVEVYGCNTPTTPATVTTVTLASTTATLSPSSTIRSMTATGSTSATGTSRTTLMPVAVDTTNLLPVGSRTNEQQGTGSSADSTASNQSPSTTPTVASRNSDSGPNFLAIGIGAGLGLLILICIFLAFIWAFKRRKSPRKIKLTRQNGEINSRSNLTGESVVYAVPSGTVSMAGSRQSSSLLYGMESNGKDNRSAQSVLYHTSDDVPNTESQYTSINESTKLPPTASTSPSSNQYAMLEPNVRPVRVNNTNRRPESAGSVVSQAAGNEYAAPLPATISEELSQAGTNADNARYNSLIHPSDTSGHESGNNPTTPANNAGHPLYHTLVHSTDTSGYESCDPPTNAQQPGSNADPAQYDTLMRSPVTSVYESCDGPTDVQQPGNNAGYEYDRLSRLPPGPKPDPPDTIRDPPYPPRQPANRPYEICDSGNNEPLPDNATAVPAATENRQYANVNEPRASAQPLGNNAGYEEYDRLASPPRSSGDEISSPDGAPDEQGTIRDPPHPANHPANRSHETITDPPAARDSVEYNTPASPPYDNDRLKKYGRDMSALPPYENVQKV